MSRLLSHQGALTAADLIDHAAVLGLDTRSFRGELTQHRHQGHVARDVESADLSGVRGTPAAINSARSHTRLHTLTE